MAPDPGLDPGRERWSTSGRDEEGFMGLWCGRMTAGGWVLTVTLWVALVGLAVWAVCRLFPIRRSPDLRGVLPGDDAWPRGHDDGPGA
jgi:hypothetical protein